MAVGKDVAGVKRLVVDELEGWPVEKRLVCLDQWMVEGKLVGHGWRSLGWWLNWWKHHLPLRGSRSLFHPLDLDFHVGHEQLLFLSSKLD